jgi:repressor LexA
MNYREKILNYIVSYIQNHGYSPSNREIGAGVGLKSVSSVSYHLKSLFDLGILESDAEFGSPRAIRVKGWKFTKE